LKLDIADKFQLWGEMVHCDLSFAVLTTVKHALFVHRSRDDQTLYVSTPFHPGAKNPSFMQALLAQVVSAYCEALERNSRTGGQDSDAGQSDSGGQDGDGGDVGCGRGNSCGGRGRGANHNHGEGNGSHDCGVAHKSGHGGSQRCYEEGIYNVRHFEKPNQQERANQDITSHREIPVATKSFNEQLAFSKVRHCLIVH
jgi:hypothetical protein